MGLLALVLYVTTLSRGAYPGESAGLMATELGVNPLGTSFHLLWSWVVAGVAQLPLGSLITRLNLLSAVCAAATVGLFFRVLADAVWAVIPVNDQNARAASRASLWAGVVGSVALMGAMPFWYVANRFHPAPFDLLLLLILAKLLLTFMRRAEWRVGLMFAVLYGACAVEFATLIVFAPLVLVAVLFALWTNGDLRWGRVLPIGGSLLLGMLLYVPATWRLEGSQVFQLNENQGFWLALSYVLKNQYHLIASSLPQIGWLLVIIVGIVPWLAVLVVARRGLNEERDWGLYWLHLSLTAVVLAVVFNAPFSPWRLLGPWRVLVTPYVLLAFCYGYLTAYWCLFPRLFFQNAEEDERGRLWIREHGGNVFGVLLLAAAIGAATLNFSAADARPAGALNQYAGAVAKAMTGRTWLVTDGLIDSNIELAAREQGLPLRLLNLQQGNNPLYMKQLARQFENVRLKSLAEVDGLAFIREWMDTDTNFASRVSFMSFPDLWVSAALQPVPDCVCFNGVRALTEVDMEALWQRHQAFWNQPFMADLATLAKKDSLLAYPAATVLRHLSMVANNLGVLLEDAGQRKQAYESYVKARALDARNISALLNQMTMLERGYASADADMVRQEFQELLKNLKQKFEIWSLSRVYGYVRMPEAYAGLGMSWAFSGQPGMAVAGYKRAIELAPDRKDQLSQGLAMAYLAQDQSAAGEDILRQLIAKEPANAGILLSLARLESRKGRYDEASVLLERAQKAGVARERIAMEYAVMHLAAGEAGKARVILQELVDVTPGLTPAWALLAGVFMMENDEKGLDECERKLMRAKGQDFITTVVLAQIALRRGRFVEARTYLDQALAMRPGTPLLLDLLLRLDVQEGRRDWAGGHIRALLLLDPGHPYANQVLASMQLERKEFAQAENSLRKSLARKSEPSVMNDLAWVLQEKGQLDEAEPLIRTVLEADGKMGVAWDTLGMILMKRGKWVEADEAFRKALALDPESIAVQFHMAVLFDKRGESAKAAELAENLLGRPAGLSQAEQDVLREISRRISRK
jgi:tetratricopeptide (TPR) repeat protein